MQWVPISRVQILPLSYSFEAWDTEKARFEQEMYFIEWPLDNHSMISKLENRSPPKMMGLIRMQAKTRIRQAP